MPLSYSTITIECAGEIHVTETSTPGGSILVQEHDRIDIEISHEMGAVEIKLENTGLKGPEENRTFRTTTILLLKPADIDTLRDALDFVAKCQKTNPGT